MKSIKLTVSLCATLLLLGGLGCGGGDDAEDNDENNTAANTNTEPGNQEDPEEAILEILVDDWQEEKLRGESEFALNVQTLAAPEGAGGAMWLVGSTAPTGGGDIYESADGGDRFEPVMDDEWVARNDIDFRDDGEIWGARDDSEISYSTDDGLSWDHIELDFPGFGRPNLRAIAFADEEHGVVVGQSRAFATTDDGGDNWEIRDVEEGGNFGDVGFADAQRGWAVSDVIKVTDDGGDSWSTQHEIAGTLLRALAIADEDRAWAVGDEGTVLHTSDGGEQWESQSSGVDEELHDIAFIDGDRGWAVGAHGTVIHTDDGGDTWMEQTPDVMPYTLNAVHFFDENEGWAAGNEFEVLRTTDGGETWMAMPRQPRAIDFVDEDYGWIGGDYGRVVHTSDGGETWVVQHTPGLEEELVDITFVDRDTGWALGQETILRTEDGGESWEVSAEKNEDDQLHFNLIKVAAPTDQVAWVIGRDGDWAGLFATEDGGETWEVRSEDLPETSTVTERPDRVHDVVFTDDEHGILVGRSGAIFRTEDGGASWGLAEHSFGDNNNEHLESVSFGSTTGYIGGPDGLIIRSTDGGATWEEDEVSTPPGNGSVDGLHFLGDDFGWAKRGQTISLTTDGGSTWTPHLEGTTEEFWVPLNSIHAIDESHAWVVGNYGRLLRYVSR